MLLSISHRTRYEYDQSVPFGMLQMRLLPESHANQHVISWDVTIEGGREQVRFKDQFENRVALLSLDSGTQSLMVTCVGEVQTEDRAGLMGDHRGYAPLWLFKRSTAMTEAGAKVRAIAKENTAEFSRKALDQGGGDIARMHALSMRIASDVAYQTGQTQAGTTAEEALSIGKGVCQDHAHIFIACARQMGFPARYVSGYLMMNDRIDQEASHAWAEVYLDGVGWVGYDISNGISPDSRYVKLATGLDYSQAAPLSGIRRGGASETMQVSIQVQQ